MLTPALRSKAIGPRTYAPHAGPSVSSSASSATSSTPSSCSLVARTLPLWVTRAASVVPRSMAMGST